MSDEEKSEEKYIIDVKPFEQQLPWSCGPSAIRTVLYHDYGIDLTDREICLVSGIDANGTDELNFELGLKTLGFKVKQVDKGTLNKLKAWLLKDCLPIVHLVVEDGCGHYMVFVGFDAEFVYLCDPAKGQIIKYGIPFFLGVWKVEEAETQTRWFIVVTGYTKNKIGALITKLKRIKKKVESA